MIGAFISNGIERIVRIIIEKLKFVSHGDLTVEFDVKRKDEFRILIEQIQLTFGNMKSLVVQVKELSEVVSESAENVMETSEEFMKSTEFITNAMNEIELGLNQQAADAEACLSQMDNLINKIQMVSDNTKEISMITDRTKGSIQDGTNATQVLN
ncbi:MAG: hypothetical protein ACK5LL_07195 [Suipraeoptans sp.]